MTRGFFTLTQGEQYIRCAYALALSLKLTQPTNYNLSIGITPGDTVLDKYRQAFDQVIEIPWEDHAANSTWKRENEWKSVYMTPYDHTIKLDADMLFFEDITTWWDILEQSDGVFATEVLTYRNTIATDTKYRQTFIANELPNVYTAFFFFKKTPVVFELFKLAEEIFYNWERYYGTYLEPITRPKFVSADVVFALAAKILGFTDNNMRPKSGIPTFVHMKTHLQGWDNPNHSEDWTQLVPQYFTPECNCKIGIYTQVSPFHYHQKHFLTDEIIGYLEKKVGI